MNYRDIIRIESAGNPPQTLLKLTSLIINVPELPKDLEESQIEGRRRGEEYLFYDVVFFPGKYRVEVWNETDRLYKVRKMCFHKMYNFGNVKTIMCNTDPFDPAIFTADAPLVPPLLAFAELTMEILDPLQPITFELEIFTHAELNRYIRAMMNTTWPRFRYAMGIMAREPYATEYRF